MIRMMIIDKDKIGYTYQLLY